MVKRMLILTPLEGWRAVYISLRRSSTCEPGSLNGRFVTQGRRALCMSEESMHHIYIDQCQSPTLLKDGHELRWRLSMNLKDTSRVVQVSAEMNAPLFTTCPFCRPRSFRMGPIHYLHVGFRTGNTMGPEVNTVPEGYGYTPTRQSDSVFRTPWRNKNTTGTSALQE